MPLSQAQSNLFGRHFGWPKEIYTHMLTFQIIFLKKSYLMHGGK